MNIGNHLVTRTGLFMCAYVLCKGFDVHMFTIESAKTGRYAAKRGKS